MENSIFLLVMKKMSKCLHIYRSMDEDFLGDKDELFPDSLDLISTQVWHICVYFHVYYYLIDSSNQIISLLILIDCLSNLFPIFD